MQVDEALDPRCYATVGIEPRTRALLTAVPYRGALLREGRSSRRQRPFWAVTLRAVDGPAAGVHAELRLWPESNREWFQGRLALLCDARARRRSRRSRSTSSARCSNATWRSARTPASSRPRPTGSPTSPISRAPRRASRCRADLPEAPLARRVPPPPDVPEAPLPHPPFALVEDAAALRARCASGSRPPSALAVDIETDCGPLGAPADWSPADGAVRLLQVAARIGGEIVCGVVDCYQVAPRPLLRLLADGREIIAHNARYEQAWLTFQFGLPAWRSVFDTSCAFRVFERHWSIQDPAYERRDATLATVTRRLLGAPKGDYGADWWGAEPLPRRAARLRRLRRGRADRAARPRARRWPRRFGCTAQVLAASRTACIEAFRRLPQPHPRRLDAACELIDARRDDAALAARRRRHPPPAAGGLAARRAARALRAARAALPAPRRATRWPSRRQRARTSARASTAQAARQSSSDALSAGLCEMPVGLRTNSIAAGRWRASTPASWPA